MRITSRWSVTLGIGLGLFGAGALPAGADPIVFISRAIFETSLGVRITEDYSAPGYSHGDIADSGDLDIHSDAHMTSVLGETRYITTGQPGTNLILAPDAIFLGDRNNPKYCAGCNGSFRLLFDATSIGTGRGVFAAGFDYFNVRDESIPGNLFLCDAFVTFGDGSSGSFDLQAAETSLSFFGITSGSRIQSIHFAPNGGREPSQLEAFGVDNLTIGSAVPEPGTRGLLGGMLALGCRGRRRAARADPAAAA